jgi:hypothetical protein
MRNKPILDRRIIPHYRVRQMSASAGLRIPYHILEDSPTIREKMTNPLTVKKSLIMHISFYVLIIITMSGCIFFSRTDELPRRPKSFINWPLSAEFFIRDKSGQEKSSFEIGEEIHFEIVVTNKTNQDIVYQATGPGYDIFIKRGQKEIWSKFYGTGFFQIIEDHTINASNKLIIKVIWTGVYNNGEVVGAGDYQIIPDLVFFVGDKQIQKPHSKVITLNQ